MRIRWPDCIAGLKQFDLAYWFLSVRVRTVGLDMFGPVTIFVYGHADHDTGVDMRGFESRLLPNWWSLRSAIPRLETTQIQSGSAPLAAMNLWFSGILMSPDSQAQIHVLLMPFPLVGCFILHNPSHWASWPANAVCQAGAKTVSAKGHRWQPPPPN